MTKGRRFLRRVMVIGAACFWVLGFNFNNHNNTTFMNNSKAYAREVATYSSENPDAYVLIHYEKTQRMLINIIKEYKQEHPVKIVPQQQKTVAQNQKVNKQTATQKPTPPPPVPKGPMGSKIVYLTIDDGPSSSTESILNILNQYHVTATFFMLEPNLRRYPSAVKTLAKDGFGLGLHGVTHDKSKFYQSTNTVVGEMKTDQDTLLKLTGIKTNLIRVPYGSVPYMTQEFRTAEVQAGFIMWDWNVDSKDWYYKDQEYVTDTIKQLEKMRGKSESPVILIHDLPTTAKYLPQLLDYLKANQYQLKKIDASISPVQFKPR